MPEMNSNFVFPVQATAPIPRPPRARNQGEAVSRDSSALRASVLETALELGIGANSLVADWMFNNAVEEEDENEAYATPVVVGPSTPIPSSSQTSIAYEDEGGAASNAFRFPPEAAHSDIELHPTMYSIGPATNKGTAQFISVPDAIPLPPNIPSVPSTPAASLHSVASKKLKKVRKGNADGYDSDGGYLSESGSKKKKKKKKAKDEDSILSGNAAHEGGLMFPEERKRKRSLVEVVTGSKKKEKVTDGYATDGASLKSKQKKKLSKDREPTDASYETDGGLKKSKSRSFFKLSSKSSKPDFSKEQDIPAVPSLKEIMPLPIAQKFSSTTAPQNSSESPIDDPDRPRSLAVSLPSAVSSKSTVNEITPSIGLGPLPSLSFQPLDTTVDLADISALSRPESPAAPAHPTSQQQSVPPVSFSHGLRGPIRDSQASSGSSSSGVSYPRSLTSGTTLSPSTSNISSSVTSPTTSHPQPSPRISHGLGPASISTSSTHGYVFVSKQDVPPAGQPRAISNSNSWLASPPAGGVLAGMKPMAFQIARDISTIPLMKMQQQAEPEPQPQDDRPLSQMQTVGNEEVEKPPKRRSFLPPVVPLNIGKAGLKLKPSLEKINLLGSRRESKDHTAIGSAPSPISPSSEAPTSWKLSPPSSSQHDRLPSPGPILPLSPGRPPRNGRPMSPPDTSSSVMQTLSPHAFISSPNTAVTTPTSPFPVTPRLRTPPNNAMGSRLNPPPNVLAYYDIPPPSPPPMVPLPSPPQLPNGNGSVTSPPRNHSRSPIPPLPNHSGPDVAQLRQRVMDRTPRAYPVDGPVGYGRGVGSPLSSSIKRGLEQPFPSEPILHRPLAPVNSASAASDELMDHGAKFTDPSPQLPPFRYPADVDRRDPNMIPAFGSNKDPNKRTSWLNFTDMPGKSIDDGSEDRSRAHISDDDDVRNSLETDGSVVSEDSGIRGVLERFTIPGSSRSEEGFHSENVLARNHSSEALDSDPPRSRFAWDDTMTVGDRNSRWSGSIYSRMSIMDEEESNAARDRFVQRVEAMLAAEAKRKNGGSENDNDPDLMGDGTGSNIARRGSRGPPRGPGRDEYIPPVPKIPDVFANTTLRSDTIAAGLSWNKF